MHHNHNPGRFLSVNGLQVSDEPLVLRAANSRVRVRVEHSDVQLYSVNETERHLCMVALLYQSKLETVKTVPTTVVPAPCCKRNVRPRALADMTYNQTDNTSQKRSSLG